MIMKWMHSEARSCVDLQSKAVAVCMARDACIDILPSMLCKHL